MENPVMSSDESIVNMLKTIRDKQVFEFDPSELKKQMVWDLIESLYSEDLREDAKTQMGSLKSNYRSKFDKETGKPKTAQGVLIEMIWNIFLNGLWWEMQGSDSEKYYQDSTEGTRYMKSWSRRFKSKNEEIKKLEKEMDKVMQEKGLITRHELQEELAKQKEKHNEQLDQKHIEGRNAYKTLQKRVADFKSNANYFEDIVDKQKIHIKYLENENADLIRQQTSATAPPPQ